jgi:spermidine synthase
MISALIQDRVLALGLIQGALLASLAIFALPSFAYGMVPPICVKLLTASTDTKTVGLSAGVITMAGSLGSFFGALITPFWLLPNLTLTTIFLSIAAIVVLAPIVLVRTAPLKSGQVLLLILFAGGLSLFAFRSNKSVFAPPVIFEQQTPYHRIRVEENPVNGVTSRFLVLDTTLEGGITPGTDVLPLEYQNTWRLIPKLGLRIDHALCIGAGSFGIPIRLSQTYPDARVEVAEIDPRVIQVGFEFFNLGQYPNVHPVATDGRVFLKESSERYDVIYIDAYHGVRYIPPHLTTSEFFRLCREHLTPNGIVMMNIISSVSGPNAELFRDFGATVRAVFPSVYFIALQSARPQSIQNVVLVCFNGSLPGGVESEMADLASYVPRDEKPIVDQQNPIEAVLARQLRQSE